MSELCAPWSVPVAQDIPLPAPQPFAAPVLISDCTTPLAGETVLTLIWRRLARDQDSVG